MASLHPRLGEGSDPWWAVWFWAGACFPCLAFVYLLAVAAYHALCWLF